MIERREIEGREKAERWGPFRAAWSAQPWVVDAMMAVFEGDDPTIEKLAHAVHNTTAIQTSLSDTKAVLRNFSKNRYGENTPTEHWRNSFLTDLENQKRWLAIPENQQRALRVLGNPTVQEAIGDELQKRGIDFGGTVSK